MALRALIAIVIVSVLAWSGYWFAFSGVHRSAVEDLVIRLRAQGKPAQYSGIRVQGFPNRFDTTIEAPSYFDPDLGLSWQAEFLQILSLSYRPYRMILAWPERQIFGIGRETVQLESENLRASLSLRNMGKPELDTFIAESGPVRLSGSSGWQSRFSEMLLAVRRAGGDGSRIEFGARASHLPDALETMPGGWIESLLGNLSSMEISLALEFDGPVTQESCAAGRTRLTGIEISESWLRWEDAQLDFSGQLTVADGKISGRLTIGAGEPGFMALVPKIPKENSGLPFTWSQIEFVAFVIHALPADWHDIHFRDGMLVYKDTPVTPVPEIRICADA